MLKRSVVFIFAAALLGAAPNVPPAAADAPQQAGASVLADARQRSEAGDSAGAVAELAAYVAAHPAERMPAVFLGDLYIRSNALKDAERTYLAALTFAPNDKELHDRLGNAYAADDLVAQALEQYQLSLPDVVAYADLVRLHRHIGDLDAFVLKYRANAENRPYDPAAQFGYGAVLRDLRRPAEAVPYLERSIFLFQRSCAARTELGNAYLDLDQQKSAAAEYRSCLAFEPDNYAALVDLSLTFDPVAQAAAAQKLLDRAYALQPNRPEALVDRGFVADATGEIEAAISYYRRALATDVLARDAYVDLGYDYQLQQRFSLAEAAFLKGLSVSPDDGRLEYLLGRAYADQGKRTLAKAEFAHAAVSDEPDVRSAAATQLATLR